MATPEIALTEQLPASPPPTKNSSTRRVDIWLVVGVAIAFGATLAGIHSTGVGLRYFFQPTGALIVLGGTLGVILVTTPGHSLVHSFRCVMDLFCTTQVNRETLIEEIVYYSRTARRAGILALEPLVPTITDSFLRNSLQFALDVTNRTELQQVLEAELRMAERQGEADARALEVAGGFAPTIGIIGTVVGLIEVLRQFSNLQSVGYGIGTAFVSTIYGLALANLLLLPAAHRIRARVAERVEIQEMMLEGVLGIVDRAHPYLIRMRLGTFLRKNTRRPDPQAAMTQAVMTYDA